MIYYMLQCLYILVLHGDAFTKAAKEHRGFFIWCQENLLIKKFVLTKHNYVHIFEYFHNTCFFNVLTLLINNFSVYGASAMHAILIYVK